MHLHKGPKLRQTNLRGCTNYNTKGQFFWVLYKTNQKNMPIKPSIACMPLQYIGCCSISRNLSGKGRKEAVFVWCGSMGKEEWTLFDISHNYNFQVFQVVRTVVLKKKPQHNSALLTIICPEKKNPTKDLMRYLMFNNIDCR